jgi:plastocyanin
VPDERGSNVRRPPWLRVMVVVPAGLLALSVVLCPSHAGGGAARAVALTAKEFLFDPRDIAVGTGEIAFAVRNQGAIEHNLALVVRGGKTVPLIATIAPGQTATVTVSLAAGDYTIYCSLPGHREAGMAATLRVIP